MIEHVHGSGEQDTLVGLTGAPANDFRQKGLPDAGVADEHNAGALFEELQIEQAHDPILGIRTTLVVFEVEAVDGVLGMEARHPETSFDGSTVASFQFHVGESFQSLQKTQIPSRRISDHLIELPAHGCQAELIQLLVKSGHEIPFGIAE